MRIFYLLIVFSISSFLSYGQVSTGFSGTGANINVDNYQIWWRLNPDSAKGIKGVVKIKFKTTVANVSSVSFDIGNSMIIDKLERGATVLSTPAVSGNKFTAVLGTTLAAIGTRDSVTISYHGVPPAMSTLGGGLGFQKTTDAAVTTANSGTTGLNSYKQTLGAGNYIYTLAESYEDRDWWPCKADMKDKADTIDISVNVPWLKTSTNDTFWVATNGTLVDSTINVTDKSRTFTFLNRYPMASYLVCVSVARYNRYYRGTVNVGGMNVPVVYYLFANKTTYAPILNAMDKVTELVQGFGSKYGDYGFIDKTKGGKHGFYEGLGSFGGMEHQTFSAISTNSLTNTSLLAHELSHQWFGDKVTFGTWNDLWLAEGFAKYSEALAPELVSGMGYTAFSEITNIKNSSLSEKTPISLPNTYLVNSDSIWAGQAPASSYGNSIYVRGAMVVSMLRKMSGDTKFFNVLKYYQTSANLAYKSASKDTLKKRFADSLGVNINLDRFFSSYVDSAGYPNYNILTQVTGVGSKTLYLSVGTQTRRLGSVSPFTPNVTVTPKFVGPVVIRAKGSTVAQDTTIVFYDWGTGELSKAGNGIGPKISGNLLSYQLSFTPTTFFYDDSSTTMSSGSLTPSSVLDLKLLEFKVKQQATYNEASLLLDDNSINSAVILERSANGNNFIEIATMILQGNAGISKRYLYNDTKPLEADNYYRAKYKNIEGVYLYSKIIKVGSVKPSNISIINNPVKDVLQLRTYDALGKDITLAIYDATGRLIKNSLVKSAGSISEISVLGLHAGIYFLKITIADDQIQDLKFLIN